MKEYIKERMVNIEKEEQTMNQMYCKRILFLIIYLFMIVFITMIVRTPNLMRTIYINPIKLFSALATTNLHQIISILLNIMLFIPLGYLVADVLRTRIILPIMVGVTVSLLVETIQYYTCLGVFEMDDLINNSLGTVIGVAIWDFFHRKMKKNIVSFVFFVMGIVGCVIAAYTQQQTPISPLNYVRQFNFHILSASYSNGIVELSGVCYIYNREVLSYELLLDDVEMDMEVKGQQFEASAPGSVGKHEILVDFAGYELISTGTYVSIGLNGDVSIEYVPEEINIPFLVPDHFILKAYNSDQVTYVFEDTINKLLFWYIGWDITPSTEIIYQLQTNEPEKLPSKRIQHGFDNRGFKAKKTNTNELESVSGFRVFKAGIPDSYNVTAITIGYNTSGDITWKHCFRVE